MSRVITTEPLSKPTYEVIDTDQADTPIVQDKTNELPCDNDVKEEINDGNDKEKTRNRQNQDCCFYIDDDDGLCLNIFCRCFSDCLQCMGWYTDAVFDCCAECLNTCCNGTPNTDQELETNYNYPTRSAMGSRESGNNDVGCFGGGGSGGDDTGCYGDGGGDDTGCCVDGGGDDTGCCGDGGGDDTGCYGDSGGNDTGFSDGGDTGCCDGGCDD